MNSSNYRFTLDLHSTQSQISLPVTLGDTARAFYISLADGGLPYLIDTGCLAMLTIKRPTGTSIEAFCAIESNTTIKYDFSQNENTAAVEGIHDCSVTLYDADGKEISSPRFTMIVSDRVVNKDDINITDEDQKAIDAIIAAEAARQIAEEGRVNAEAARVSAEEQRVSSFNEMMSFVKPYVTEVTIFASKWVGDKSPYSQVVNVEGVTARSRVDLLPSVEQLDIFHEKDLAFVTENEGGVITVYAVGDKPTKDYTIQVTVVEVEI